MQIPIAIKQLIIQKVVPNLIRELANVECNSFNKIFKSSLIKPQSNNCENCPPPNNDL